MVIPKEMRRSMDIGVGDPLEFYIDAETGFLSMRKYTGASCKMCSSVEYVTYFRDSFLCKRCIHELKGNIGVSHIPVPVVKEPTHQEKKTHQPSHILIERLRELIREHPNARQGEYAKWLGVSQGRIPQLKKLL
ncbi:AbrB/MazE/SpoVT family DNA-binding domain-containing protein [Paenibacillus peoriae]|nr:AbrB/MazE/SpoVT family DNA-binding domain-containing protein [Paenibacillus peoriae]MEC0181206.1 AbrB/MazE/SpoVT family DNA-binding domain-containing protein [Paenibacillus peoriae]